MLILFKNILAWWIFIDLQWPYWLLFLFFQSNFLCFHKPFFPISFNIVTCSHLINFQFFKAFRVNTFFIIAFKGNRRFWNIRLSLIYNLKRFIIIINQFILKVIIIATLRKMIRKLNNLIIFLPNVSIMLVKYHHMLALLKSISDLFIFLNLPALPLNLKIEICRVLQICFLLLTILVTI